MTTADPAGSGVMRGMKWRRNLAAFALVIHPSSRRKMMADGKLLRKSAAALLPTASITGSGRGRLFQRLSVTRWSKSVMCAAAKIGRTMIADVVRQPMPDAPTRRVPG